MIAARMASRLVPRLTRQFTSSAAKRNSSKDLDVHPVYFKLKEQQAKFKENLHLPVHRKGGSMDDVLRYATYALCAGIVVQCVACIYELSFPPKKD